MMATPLPRAMHGGGSVMLWRCWISLETGKLVKGKYGRSKIQGIIIYIYPFAATYSFSEWDAEVTGLGVKPECPSSTNTLQLLDVPKAKRTPSPTSLFFFFNETFCERKTCPETYFFFIFLYLDYWNASGQILGLSLVLLPVAPALKTSIWEAVELQAPQMIELLTLSPNLSLANLQRSYCITDICLLFFWSRFIFHDHRWGLEGRQTIKWTVLPFCLCDFSPKRKRAKSIFFFILTREQDSISLFQVTLNFVFELVLCFFYIFLVLVL